jgi:hypothetical protein
MSAYNFPKPFSTGLKIQLFLPGSWATGAGGLYLVMFLHGALTGLTVFTMIIILTGGL